MSEWSESRHRPFWDVSGQPWENKRTPVRSSQTGQTRINERTKCSQTGEDCPETFIESSLHLHSEFHINRSIWRRDIAKKRLSIWRPSAILDLLWRHHIASGNCILCSQLCVKFSRLSVAYFLKYIVFHVSAFWPEIAYFGLNFDDFWWKIGENVKINYLNPQKAHAWRKTRLISVDGWRFILRCDL